MLIKKNRLDELLEIEEAFEIIVKNTIENKTEEERIFDPTGFDEMEITYPHEFREGE